MTINRIVIFYMALIIPVFAACQPQVELEPAQPPIPPATTAPEPTPAPLKTIIKSPILETVTPTSTTASAEEQIMHEEQATESPESKKTESTPVEAAAVMSTDNAPEQARVQPSPEAVYPAGVQGWIDHAVNDLAVRHSLASEEIEIISYEDKVWSDSSLGCPQPGMRYLQVLKEGYLIQLRAGDEIFNYHGGEGRDEPFLCEQPGPEIVITKQTPFDIKQTPTKSVPPSRD